LRREVSFASASSSRFFAAPASFALRAFSSPSGSKRLITCPCAFISSISWPAHWGGGVEP
jgi:hypothetical protein